MHVVILIAVFIISAYYALSIPPVGEEFSPRRKKFNKLCQLILVLIVGVSLCFVFYNKTFATMPEDYDINTDVYCIVLKTDGHRLLSFVDDSKNLVSHTIFGDEAKALMESAFGDMTKGSLMSWNEAAAWQGKYSARVYYTEEEYQRKLDGLSPLTIARNDTEKGTMYYFTIIENGKVYANVGGSVNPYYCVKVDRDVKNMLFPK
ncbi:MAG: hypothetical protein IIY00_00480 [Clostridia bacterium]|nr:hypothetical protein [Clostridia bacterium]